MKSLFFYLIQVVVVSGILYAYYHVALRNKKFHQYNRFYILGATLASILIPFLNIPVYFSNDDTSAQWLHALQNLSGQPVVIVSSGAEVEESFSWQGLLYILYAVIALVGLSKIILSVYRLKKIMRQHPAEHLNGIRFINTAEPGTPFSFFRWLFWNNRIELSSQKGEQIFRHEIYHIEQKHSLDAVFMEMITIVFWINPLFHLMKKELKAIHEFLADQFASDETEKWEYAEMLLMQALNTQHSLVHPFFHNQIKRRIAMITNPQKTSHQYLRKMLVLPLAALLITLFAFSYKEKQNDALEEIELQNLAHLVTTDTVPASEFTTELKADIVSIQGKGYNKENQKIPPSLIIYNNRQFTNDEFASFTGEKGHDVVIEAKSVITTPANDANAIAKYGEKARNGVLEFKSANLDTVPKKQPVTIKITGSATLPDKQPLIVLDGVIKEDAEYQKTLSGIDPNTISAISVLKDAQATGVYGEKGRNGVLVITTKAHAENDKAKPSPDLKEVIIVGNVLSKKEPDQFQTKPDKPIEEVTVVGYAAKKVQGIEIKEVPTTKNIKLDEVVVTGYATKKVQGVLVKEVPVTRDLKLDEVTVVGRPAVSRSLAAGSLEVEPAFPGGASAWYNFLVKNLDAATPAKKGAPEGQYTVYVRMKVDKDGRLSDFKALTNHGYGMEEAAINALEKSPYWNPGYKNGVAVGAFKSQPITFAVVNEKASPKTELTNENLVTIYPNPVKDNLSVQFNSKKSRTVGIRIIDVNGKTYSTSSLNLAKGSTTNSISTADLAPGTYFLQVNGSEKSEKSTFKFVKE